jgi:hypothetical protein
MMTDPMTPLGASLWQVTSPAPMTTDGTLLDHPLRLGG